MAWLVLLAAASTTHAMVGPPAPLTSPLHCVPVASLEPPFEQQSHQHHFFAAGPRCASRHVQFSVVPWLLRHLPVPPDSNPPPGLPPPAPHPNPYRRLKPTYALVVAYDGTRFPGGYEHNPKLDAPTVRGVLSSRISAVLGQMAEAGAGAAVDDDANGSKNANDNGSNNGDDNGSNTAHVHLATAGRTDARVSAKAALLTLVTKAELDTSDFLRALNESGDDADVVVHSVTPVHASFHATFGTKAREYLYVLPLLAGGAPAATTAATATATASNSLSTLQTDYVASETSDEYAMRVARVANILLSDVLDKELDYVGMSSRKITTLSTLCTIRSAGCWYYTRDGTIRVSGKCSRHGNEVGDMEEDVVPDFGKCWKLACADAERRGGTNDNGDNDNDNDNDNDDSGGKPPMWSGCLAFRIKSDRFLRRMMRKTINSVLQEASAVVDENKDVLENGNIDNVRHWAGRWRRRVQEMDRSGNTPAPPMGLCLWKVEVI